MATIDVSSVTPRVAYYGDGSTVAFAIPFVFFADADLKVYVAGVLKTLTTHYTVSGAGGAGGGTVTLLSAPTVGQAVVIVRDSTLANATHFPVGGPFNTETLNLQINKLTTWVQELKAKFSRFVRLPDEDVNDLIALPVKDSRKNTVLLWDANGDPVAGPTAANISSAQTYADAAEASATAAAASASSAATSAAKIPNPAGAGDANKLLQVNGTGTAYLLTTVSITGDVTGPASAADFGVVLFNGTTGKQIKAGPALGAAGQVLKSQGAGAAPIFGTVDTAGITANAVTNAKLARAGTSGQVLTSQGAGADPVWAALPASGEVNTGQNVGSGSGVFKQKSGVTLQFKSITVNNANANADAGYGLDNATLSFSAGADDLVITLTRTYRAAPPSGGA